MAGKKRKEKRQQQQSRQQHTSREEKDIAGYNNIAAAICFATSVAAVLSGVCGGSYDVGANVATTENRLAD